MNRKTLLAGGAGALLAAPALRAQAQTAPIRVAITDNDSGIAPYYAQAQGMFARAGLNVDIQQMSSSGGAAQALVAGAVDIAVCDALQVANAMLHGFPMIALAGGCAFSKDSPTLELVTAKNSPIRSARDLEGQTAGVVALKSLSASSVNEWLRLGGADPSKVKFLELPFPDMNGALARGTLSVALLGEPFLTAGRADQRVLAVPFEAVGSAFYVNVLATSRDWATKNPLIAKRFTAAMFETARWANTHRAESATLEAGLTKIPLETVRSMARNVFATSWDPKLLDPVLAVGARYKLTDRLVSSAEITAP